MKKIILLLAISIGVLLAFTPKARAWIQFLDGSALPEPPWIPFSNEGNTAVVDIGAGNFALELDSPFHTDTEDPHKSGNFYNEYYIDFRSDLEKVAATRFRLAGFTPTGAENILSPSTPQISPGILLANGEYWVWSMINDTPILDLGPAVTNQWHTAYIWLRPDYSARVIWDGVTVFDGTVAADDPPVGGYVEFGSGTYWETTAGTVVDFDWVGWGDASDLPRPALSIRGVGSNVLVSWSTNDAGFLLQSSTDLTSSNWIDVINPVSVVGTQYAVTNASTAPAQYYRLISRPLAFQEVTFNDAPTPAVNIPNPYAGLNWSSEWFYEKDDYAGFGPQAYIGVDASKTTGTISGGGGGPFLLKSLLASSTSGSTTFSLTNNGISIYYAAKKSPDPKMQAIAEDIQHADYPIGPAGKYARGGTMFPAFVFRYSKYPKAAKEYLRFMMEKEQYEPWQAACIGYVAHPLRAYEANPVWKADPQHIFFRDVVKNMRHYGYAGKLGKASAAAIADFIVVDMFGEACTGAQTPKEAARRAEKRAQRHYRP